MIELDDDMRSYIQRGIVLNMTIAEKGIDMKRTGYQIRQMMLDGLMADDLFYQVKLRVACAVDARMGGMPEPVIGRRGTGQIPGGVHHQHRQGITPGHVRR